MNVYKTNVIIPKGQTSSTGSLIRGLKINAHTHSNTHSDSLTQSTHTHTHTHTHTYICIAVIGFQSTMGQYPASLNLFSPLSRSSSSYSSVSRDTHSVH